MASFSPYPCELLPEGFCYPQQYLDLAKGIGTPSKFLWWFIDADTSAGKRSWELREDKGDGLIPFAREGDWAAYFDPENALENPRVFVVDLGNKSKRYTLNNFSEWYEKALADTEKYMS